MSDKTARRCFLLRWLDEKWCGWFAFVRWATVSHNFRPVSPSQKGNQFLDRFVRRREAFLSGSRGENKDLPSEIPRDNGTRWKFTWSTTCSRRITSLLVSCKTKPRCSGEDAQNRRSKQSVFRILHVWKDQQSLRPHQKYIPGAK